MKRDDATLWFRQAADDYRFGRAVDGRFYAQACFIAPRPSTTGLPAAR